MKKIELFFVIVVLAIAAAATTVGTAQADDWDKSSISLGGSCQGSSACFTITNNGSAMTGSSEWRVYVDGVLTDSGSFQLGAGQSVTHCFSYPGHAVRFEADQRPGHPGNSHPKLTLNCGSTSTPTATATATATDVFTDTPTATATTEDTATPTSTAENTATATATNEDTPTATSTTENTVTATFTQESTPTATTDPCGDHGENCATTTATAPAPPTCDTLKEQMKAAILAHDNAAIKKIAAQMKAMGCTVTHHGPPAGAGSNWWENFLIWIRSWWPF